MPDSRRGFEREPVAQEEIERNLRELGSRMEYPPTPDLAQGVRQRLEEETEDTGETPVRHGRGQLPLAPRWAVAAVALALVVSLPLLSQGVRDTLSGAFAGAGSAGSAASGGAVPEGAGGQAASETSGDSAGTNERRGVTVSGSASQTASGADEAVTGASTEFGDPLTLEQARARLDGRLFLPQIRALGEPEEVYELDEIRETQTSGVAVVYVQRPGLPSLGGTGAGLVLAEIPGSLRSMYPGKDPAQSTGVEEVRVGGGRGYWVAGRDELPPPLDMSVHPPANVLVWERGGLVLRLETELPREEAVQLAESVR